MSARQLSCEEVLHRLADFLDRELSAAESRLVEEHLAVCERCAREHRFERAVLDEMRAKLRQVEVPGELVGRIRRALAAS